MSDFSIITYNLWRNSLVFSAENWTFYMQKCNKQYYNSDLYRIAYKNLT